MWLKTMYNDLINLDHLWWINVANVDLSSDMNWHIQGGAFNSPKILTLYSFKTKEEADTVFEKIYNKIPGACTIEIEK